VAHRDTVVDRNRIELDTPTARRVDYLFHSLSNVMQMDMSWNELSEAVGNGNDWLFEVSIVHARGTPQGASACHVSSGC
jgi:hypothetical protein